MTRGRSTGALLVLASCGDPTQVPAGDAPPLPVADAASLDTTSPPEPPPGLVRWLIGNPADVHTSSRAGVILMGGGPDVDAAFAWQRDRIGGGDVVVLRTSGADGYNPYLYTDIGGVDSVETLRVDSRALADDAYVRWVLDHAEAIFIAGGDQSTYVTAWANTAVSSALSAAWQRGVVVGGTSAGCAFLGGVVYTAANGSVLSSEALDDPFDPYVTLAPALASPAVIRRVVTDTHFAQRDRMGRLLAFTARAWVEGLAVGPLGLGVDEGTALVIDEAGLGSVVGQGSVYVLAPDAAPTTCAAGQPLRWSNVRMYELQRGDQMSFPSGATTAPPSTLSAGGGTLSPANPY